MMKPKYILLTFSLIELAIGLSNARQNTFFYPGAPGWRDSVRPIPDCPGYGKGIGAVRRTETRHRTIF
jgi:hypothetical protein